MKPLVDLRAKWTLPELVSTFVELVGDFDDDCVDRVDGWSGPAADFLRDAQRLVERPDLVPSFAQVKWAAKLHARFVDRDGWGETVADELERLLAAGDKGPPAPPRPAQIDDFDPDATTATTTTRARRPPPADDDGVAYRAPGYRPPPEPDDCDDEPTAPKLPPRRRWIG